MVRQRDSHPMLGSEVSTGCRRWWANRVFSFVVVVNKFVYKLVVIVNEQFAVDKDSFLHNVNGLRSG